MRPPILKKVEKEKSMTSPNTTAMNVGIVGCGNISSVYLKNCTASEYLNVLAVADLDMERAKVQAERFGVPHVLSVEELLTTPMIGLVINLTMPAAHATVGLAAIRAGKSIYNEKPLAISRE